MSGFASTSSAVGAGSRGSRANTEHALEASAASRANPHAADPGERSRAKSMLPDDANRVPALDHLSPQHAGEDAPTLRRRGQFVEAAEEGLPKRPAHMVRGSNDLTPLRRNCHVVSEDRVDRGLLRAPGAGILRRG